MPLWIKKSPSEWVPGTKIWVKKSPTEWVPALRAWIKQGVTWVQFWPKSGPFTTVAPFFSSDSGGNNRIIEPIVYGTTFYGQRGSWDGNGGTISSYTYKLDSVTSATIGEGTITNIIPETSMGSTSVSITANSSDYDGKWMLFTVKATRSDGVFGSDDTDNTDTGTGYRIPVIKNKPTLGTTNTTLWINGSPGINTKPAPGDAVSLIATWDSTENKSIDGTRTITKWYRSSTFPTLNTTSPKAASGGYYETTGATLLGTGIAYVVTSADNNSYIFANQEVFNSFTDYTYGTTEGNGIKTGAAFTQTVGAPYSFAMGNILYPSTNGSVGFDSGYGGTALPSSGRHLFVYGLDLVSVSTKHWSNNKDYIIQYTGGQVFNPTVAAFQITYQVKFSTDHPSYALVRIINKGSNVPQPNYIGYYEGSTQISTVAGPYVLDTGSTYRINFNGTAGTTSGITFAGVNNAAFLTDFGAGNDNTFYTLVTGTFQYALPTITFNTPTIGGTSISYAVASTGNDFASYDYIVRTGSHTGTVFTSGSLQTGTLSITGLSNGTTYYIQVDPYNSQNQNGTRMFFDATTFTPPATPTITYTNVTFNSFTVSWSSTGATSYNVSIFESVSGNSVFSANGTTATVVSPSGLQPNRSYSTTVTAINAGGTATNTVSQTTSLGPALTPTFGTNSSTVGGFIGSVTNFDENYTFGISTSAGSVAFSAPSGSTRGFTVSGLSNGQSATVTVTTSRTGYSSGSAQTIGSATLVQYTVTWDANGGSVSPGLNTVNAGLSVIAPTPTRNGFTFSTWRNPLSGGDPILLGAGASYTPTANITFFAIWTVTPIIPTITMGANTGVTQTTGTINWTSTNQASFSITGAFAGSGTSQTSLSRTGLTAGTTYTGTVTVTSSTGHTASANYSLTTSAPQYTVTWNANGGSGGGTTGPFNAGTAHFAPSPGTRAGFTFAGYRDTPSGDSLYGPIASGGSFTPPSNITMYARWSAIVPNISQIVVAGNGTAGVTCTVTGTNMGSIEFRFFARDTTTTAWTQVSSGTAAPASSTSATISTTGSVGALPDQYYVEMTPYFGPRSTTAFGGGTGTAGILRSTIGSPKNNQAGSVTVIF